VRHRLLHRSFPRPASRRSCLPGLEGRGLNLPPGIAKKLEAGGIAPAGIAKRFPTAAVQVGTPISDTTGTETGDAAQPADGSQVNVPSVDLLV
jgi:hypothetical protein